jgi:hypothetical protein
MMACKMVIKPPSSGYANALGKAIFELIKHVIDFQDSLQWG